MDLLGLLALAFLTFPGCTMPVLYGQVSLVLVSQSLPFCHMLSVRFNMFLKRNTHYEIVE